MHGKPSATLQPDKIADSRPARIAEYKRRRKLYDTKRVSEGDLQEALDAGWKFDKKLLKGVRVRRAKSLDEHLENQFWIFLYLLGYERLNIGRNFKAQVNLNGHEVGKQIDVFAIDDETVVVAECKTAKTQRSRSLQADLSEFDSVKRQIANATRAYLSPTANPKILWFIVTSRIRWSKNDLARAEEKRIHVIREHELLYFMEIAKSLGGAARYQFHAEFLAGQKIPALADRYVPASKFRLGGRDAYAFTISARDLLRRSFVNHRDLRDPSGAPSYQRLINPRRLKKIAAFLDGGGYFANSVLVNFHERLRFDGSDRDQDLGTRFGRLYLPDTYKSCWVIDGQHRIYGAAVVSERTKSPVIPVIAFEQLPAEEEANLFATINREQRQVEKRLLDELEGELNWAAEDPRQATNAIASRSLDILRNEVLGPFEDRISRPGVRGRQQPLTVPQLKLAIVQSGLIGRISSRDGRFLPGPLTGPTHESTLANLVAFLSQYFEKIRDANPDRWASLAVPLCHNVAVPGIIRLTSEVVRYLESVERVDVNELSPADLAEQVAVASNAFIEYCRQSADDEFRSKFPIKFGSGGPRIYYLTAAALIRAQNPTFNPTELDEFLDGTQRDHVSRADQLVKDITDRLHGHVVGVLKRVYGPEFFELGIKNKEIKIRAYSKRADTDPTGKTPLENYLEILDLKKIAEASENWIHFKETLNIQLPTQAKGLAKYLKWIDEFNEVRKTYAHPYNRSYSKEDLELLSFVGRSLPNTSPQGPA